MPWALSYGINRSRNRSKDELLMGLPRFAREIPAEVMDRAARPDPPR